MENVIAEAEVKRTEPESLTAEQVRVLGCLLEKEQTTPDYYPLTLNGVLTACNQSTNREPIVSYSEGAVLEALEGLKARQFAMQITMSGARVQKFKHNLERKFPWLEKPEIALLTVLLLRGPQTVGELRQRSERMQVFPDLETVEATLKHLEENEHGEKLVVCFPPGPGRKSALYLHTLAGIPESPNPAPLTTAALPQSMAAKSAVVDEEWKLKMEAELALLRLELDALKAKLSAIL
jgi:uncharacterized protein